jgi:cell wall-active antibiotic response 4TMS protein YvqF/B-box zinc finger protein
MNCLNHPDTPAAAFCRSCGKPLCDACRRLAQGTIYCEEHVPAQTAAAPPPQPVPTSAAVPASQAPPVADPSVSPGLALGLGLIIPGVGAIYNGQYAKGLVHAIIFGLLISVLSSDSARGLEPLFGVLLAAWVFYMGAEAYHTARKRRAGQPVDEFSSLIDLHVHGSSFPAGAVVLILVGALLLLNTTDLIPLEKVLKYWPVLLILFGVYLLYVRLAGAAEQSGAGGETQQEVRHDHR